MKLISLAEGRGFAMVDDDDYEEINRYKWHLREYRYSSGRILQYAVRYHSTVPGAYVVAMHDHIAKPPEGMVADHRDKNGLNNQRTNLRVCTVAQNNMARRQRYGKRFKGVHKDTFSDRWRATIKFESVVYNSRLFTTEEEAAVAYDMAAFHLHKEFAWLNFPDRDYSALSEDEKWWLKGKGRDKGETGYRGVSASRPGGRKVDGLWRAAITHKYRTISLGCRFATPEEAAEAFDKAACVLGKKSWIINFPDKDYTPDLPAMIAYLKNKGVRIPEGGSGCG